MNSTEHNSAYHLFDENVVVERSNFPSHYLPVRLSFNKLKKLARSRDVVQDLYPIRIFKEGISLINSYNLPENKLPNEIISKYELQSAEIPVRRAFAAQCVLGIISEIMDLPEGHLNIDVTREYLSVRSKESVNMSAVMPTNFKNGVKFTIPHDDHQYDLGSKDLPGLQIGKHTYIGADSSLDLGSGISIGNRVFIARNCHRLGHIHDVRYPGISRQIASATNSKFNLFIGDDVLVGYESDIAARTEYIGQNAVLGQRSTITKSWVGDFSVVVGNGRTVRYLPVQAYFKIHYPKHIDSMNILRINWNGTVKEEWELEYKKRVRALGIRTSQKKASSNRVLVLGKVVDVPRVAKLIIDGCYVDVINSDMDNYDLWLQLAEDYKNYNLRLKTVIPDIDHIDISLYDTVIDNV